MKTVQVYTMEQCPYCEAAKKLLQTRGIEFEEIRLSEDDDAAWKALYRRTGLKTVPQIFAGEKLIGGFTELVKQDKKDGLAFLKAA